MIELLISILGTLCAAGIKIACEQYFKRRYEDEIREEVDGWYSYLPGFLRKKRGARYVRLIKPTGVLDSESDDDGGGNGESDQENENSESSDDESNLSSITSSSSHEHWKDPEESVSEEGNKAKREMEEGVNRESDVGGEAEDNGEDREDVSLSASASASASDSDSEQDSETQSLLNDKDQKNSITVVINPPESVYYDTKSSAYSHEHEQDLENHNLEN